MREFQDSVQSRRKISIVIYIACLAVYLLFAGSRLWHLPKGWHEHYTILAQGFLEGRLALKGKPPHGNDWARVTKLQLKDGTELRGQFLKGRKTRTFRTTEGDDVPVARGMIRKRSDTYYVSFPWFPALLMLPFVAIWGVGFNDVIFTALIAAFNPVLLFLILRRFVDVGLSTRTVSSDLWLVVMLAFGTAHFYSSVLGQVWYTAHIVGVCLSGLYVLASIEARRPAVAGSLLGLMFVTRPPMLLLFPFLVGEIIRKARLDSRGSQITPSRRVLRPLARAFVPAFVILLIAAFINESRFDSPFEFGHSYLNIYWSERIQRFGNFSLHFVGRNLTAFFLLIPRFAAEYPYIQVSCFGLSVFITSPYLGAAFFPRERTPLHLPLYLSLVGPFILHATYQNTGFEQFGYRFGLDFMIPLMILVALSHRTLYGWSKLLIVWGIIVNVFGALTFLRMHQFYWHGFF